MVESLRMEGCKFGKLVSTQVEAIEAQVISYVVDLVLTGIQLIQMHHFVNGFWNPFQFVATEIDHV